MDDIKQNLAKTHAEISQFKGAHLLAVSKKQSIEKIKLAYDFGQKNFGENYMQELLEKTEALKSLNISWHFIGRIQKNKLSKIVGVCEYIHSVDSIETLKKISELCEKKQIKQKIFLQVNQGSEDSKGGFLEKELLKNWKQISEVSHITICGLMSLPPLSEDEDKTRTYFRQLQDLLKKLKALSPQLPLNELSMGTSSDYKIALAEGATWVRLGTSLFGARP